MGVPRILITGSSRGIGAAIARDAGRHGFRVVVNYRSDWAGAMATAETIRASGGQALVVQGDVRYLESVQKLFAAIKNEFGGLDILINNAHHPFTPKIFTELSWEEVMEQVTGSVGSCFHCTQIALPYLRQGRFPAILNISSISVARPVPGYCHRNLAKAAVEGLTRNLALELAGEGIRVNALGVGWTQTGQLEAMPDALVQKAMTSIPMGRLATPEEIAATAMWIVSPAAAYITGQVIPVAGGL